MTKITYIYSPHSRRSTVAQMSSFDGNSLLSHLNSLLVTKLYDRITSYPSTKCVDCEKYDMCGGGCMMFWTSFKPEECIPGWK